MENRRQFTRILFSLNASLIIENTNYVVSILDISLNGVLISHQQTTTAEPLLRKFGVLRFALDNNAEIIIDVAVVHQEDEQLGLQVNAIDIESIGHLKRIIELNLGNDEQFNKELSQLSAFK